MREQKFRVLDGEELASLEKEFVDFLILNGIPAADWQVMKIDESDQAEEMIGIFSDMIFETIMLKTKYIEHFSDKHYICYDVLDGEVNCISISVKNTSSLKLELDIIGNQLSGTPVDEYEIVFAKKKKPYDRSVFIYNELQKGFTVANGKLYRSLIALSVE